MKGVMYWSKPHYWTMRNIRLHSGPIAINSTKCPPNIGCSYDKSLIHTICDSNIWGIHLKESPSAVISLMIIFFFSWRFPKIFQSLEWDVVPWFALFVRIRHQLESQGDTNFYQWLDFYVRVGFLSLNGTHLLENSKYDCYGEKGLYALTV